MVRVAGGGYHGAKPIGHAPGRSAAGGDDRRDGPGWAMIWVYLKLMLASSPLFFVMFCYTWWIRGRGFREFAAIFRPLLRPFERLRSRWRDRRASSGSAPAGLGPPARDAAGVVEHRAKPDQALSQNRQSERRSR